MHPAGATVHRHPRTVIYAGTVTWDDYRVLLAFARAGNLSKTAESLGVDKATVSRRIGALEQELGAELVNRLPSGWQLTQQGRTVAGAAEQMERAVLGAGAEVRGEGPRGSVRLTAPVWFARRLLLPRVTTFRERYPDVELEVLATNAVLDLVGREAEIGIRNLVPPQSSMVTRKLGALGSALYAAPEYLTRRGTPESRDDLSAHAFVAYHDAITYCPSLSYLHELDPSVVFRASDTEVLLEAVRAGLGLGIVPCYVGDLDPSVARTLPEVFSQDDIYACYPETLKSLPRIRCVLDWLADVWSVERGALAGERLDSEP